MYKNKLAFTLAEVLITLGIIGVVAALTIPTLLTNYRKHLIESNLKQNYALLLQTVKMAEQDNGQLDGWDYELDVSDFVNTYFINYIKIATKATASSSVKLTLNNGAIWTISRYTSYLNPTLSDYTGGANHDRVNYYRVSIDVNGDSNPNTQGKDRFNFYIMPAKNATYGSGDGAIAQLVPSAGIYSDGSGYSESYLTRNTYRGCHEEQTYYAVGSYCVTLIMRNNWKIPANYPLKI